MDILREDVEIVISPETQRVEHTPNPIDEYLVIVNFPEDWEVVHNYIVEENEIDGIPNRKIPCTNLKEYSLRASVYEMSNEEAEILRTHPKVESVELNPAKYPQPRSLMTARFKKDVAFNKPGLTAALDTESTAHTNGIRSNWSITFANTPSSEPYRGVGITSTTIHNTDVSYSLTGKNVDAVIIDEGCGVLHPEFIADDGTYRAKDLILDGPYKVDPDYFTSNNHTYTKIIDGVNLGVGISTSAAHSWWTNSSNRSAAFQSLGTISSIDSRYTVGHSQSKTANSDSNQMTGGHGTACASQVGGKSFGLAFECNIWSIRIDFGDAYIDASEALDMCTIFHNAKKISQNGDPDPTITNNSYGFTSSTGNTDGVNYSTGYRGSTLTYTGNGSNFTVQANGGAARNTKTFTHNTSGSTILNSYGFSGQYNSGLTFGSADNSSAESAIAAGVIVVSSAGNNNQKLADSTDVDFDNWYSTSTNYICRVGSVQKGFSGSNDARNLGAIRVGALDCAVEPSDSLQGATAYAIRKVCYSANGPMINIWAPGEKTMAAGYAGSYEDYQREDDTNFYDTWFNGTSAAGPNAVSLICLYLESNRKANQDDVREWLDRHGSREIDLSDPYPDINETGYWSQSFSESFDAVSINNSSNVRGNGNLRGAPKRVIHNPYANDTIPSLSGVSFTGFLFDQGGSSQTVAGSSSVAPVEGGDSGGGGGGGGGALSISITSSSFSNGASIGGAYYITGGNCHPQAANTSPQVSWTVSGNTSGADSIRCLCLDVDASNFIHWMVFSIPLESGSISENGSWPSGSSVQTNDWDGVLTSRANGWGGPCPDSQHTYNINFYVVDSGGSILATSNTLSFEAG